MEHQFVIALSHFDAALYQDLLGRLLHIIPNGGPVVACEGEMVDVTVTVDAGNLVAAVHKVARLFEDVLSFWPAAEFQIMSVADA